MTTSWTSNWTWVIKDSLLLLCLKCMIGPQFLCKESLKEAALRESCFEVCFLKPGRCRDLSVSWLSKTCCEYKFCAYCSCLLPIWSGLPLSSVSLYPPCRGLVSDFIQGTLEVVNRHSPCENLTLNRQTSGHIPLQPLNFQVESIP